MGSGRQPAPEWWLTFWSRLASSARACRRTTSLASPRQAASRGTCVSTSAVYCNRRGAGFQACLCRGCARQCSVRGVDVQRPNIRLILDAMSTKSSNLGMEAALQTVPEVSDTGKNHCTSLSRLVDLRLPDHD